MCGRYFLEDSSELRPIVEEMNRSPLLPLFLKSPGAVVCSGEAAPSRVVPVIALSRSGKRAVFPMKWGYTVPKPGDVPGKLAGSSVPHSRVLVL